MAGASVFLVEVSYGAHHSLHDASSEYGSFEIPVIIELVDAIERVEQFLCELRSMVTEGLIAIRPVRVWRGIPAADTGNDNKLRSAREAGRVGEPVLANRSDTAMQIDGDAQRVTVYIGQSDTWHGMNLAVAIVQRCREMGIAGATASRGVMGFGANSIIHRAHLLGLSEDVPERVEIVDRPEQVARLLPILDEMVQGGMIVVEDVRVVRYLREPKAN
jgi:PII-like signaling protein